MQTLTSVRIVMGPCR